MNNGAPDRANKTMQKCDMTAVFNIFIMFTFVGQSSDKIPGQR